MAMPNKASLVIFKTISEEEASTYYVRRTSEALDLLCGDTSASGHLPEPRVINLIKKLKNTVTELRSDLDYNATPIWNNSATDINKLEPIGLSLEEVEALRSISPIKTPGGADTADEDKLKSELVPQILFALEVLDYDEVRFTEFMQVIKRYPAIGIMICEILCDDKILAKARLFLVKESFDQKREILFQFMKKKLENCHHWLSLIHMVASCGDQIRNIVPDGILVHFHARKLSPYDMAVIAKVASYSTIVEIMHVDQCHLNDDSIVVLRDGLSKSNVKIRFLDISSNPDIDVKGWRCVGDVVKNHEVEILWIWECELTREKLDAFSKSSGNCKIHSLNIRNNPNIDGKVWSCIGELVKNHEVKKLDFSVCGLTHEKLDAFNKSSGNCKIHSLDISSNPGIDVNGWCCVGELVKNHEVEAVVFSYCKLKHEKLDAFNKSSGNRKIRKLDVSSNPNLGEQGFETLGYIVKRHDIDSLVIGHWHPNDGKQNLYNEIALFCAALGDKEIKHVTWEMPPKYGISMFELGQRLMVVCELSLKVAERLELENLFGYDHNFTTDEAFEGLILLQDFINVHNHQNLTIEFEYDFSWNRPPPSIRARESCELYVIRLEKWRMEVLNQKGQQHRPSSGVEFPIFLFDEEKVLSKSSGSPFDKSSTSAVRGSPLFKVYGGHIELEPFETCMQVYQEKFPKLRWDSKGGEDLVKTPKLSESKFDFARRYESLRSKGSTSDIVHGIPWDFEKRWLTNPDKLSTSEGFAVDPTYQANIKSSMSSTQAEKALSPITKFNIEVGEDDGKFEVAGTKNVAVTATIDSATHIEGQGEGSSTDHPTKHIFPTETADVTVGIGAKIINVGGCVVEFPAGSFSDPQEITVIAEINPRNWPPDREAITPSLSVRAKNLLKEATVKLHTWCCSGEDEEDNVEIWRHTKKENKWEIIQTYTMRDSRFIEFKVSHFCSIFATLKRLFTPTYIIQPMVYYSTWEFVVALIKDTPAVEKHLRSQMETIFGKGMQRRVMSPLTCKKSDKIKTLIYCMPKEGFEFKPGDTFLHPIHEVYGQAKKSYHSMHLTSSLPAQSITVAIKFLKDDIELRTADGFRHQWKPDVTSHSNVERQPLEDVELSARRSTPPPTTSAESRISESQLQDESTDEKEQKTRTVDHGDATSNANVKPSGQASSPTVNVHVKVDVHDDHRKSEVAGMKVVGGTVNKTCYDSPTNVKGLEEN